MISMDEKTQKERLEQELRFLKESFEAEVISKEEFEKGKDRIGIKLKEINNNGKQASSDNKEKTDEHKELKNEDKDEKDQKNKPLEEKNTNELPIPDKDAHEKEVVNSRNQSKFFYYAAVFVILVLIAFFSYSLFKEKKTTTKNEEVSIIPACVSNEDCKQEGMEGICINNGAKDAKCEFSEEKINVLIINDRENCFSCDTKRVIGILQEWFGSLDTREIDYSTNEGRRLADKFGARLLPIYILDSNITKKLAFQQSGQVFINKNGTYILSDDASGSPFYFNRQNEENKLDLFVRPDDAKSVLAEGNLQEFLETFKEVKFEKHSSDNLAKELGIKVFPTFLINNRIKFIGAQPADVIKENFCKLNKLPNCNLSLSKNLV